jgi:hypothetical protein
VAWLCQQPYQRRYAASANLWQQAFHNQPDLASNPQSGNRYNAACAAALAGCAQGKDAGQLDAKEKSGWRDQARQWLQADLALWKQSAESGTLQDRQLVQAQMLHWQQDTDLAGVRESYALATLTAGERDAWCRLWAEVAAARNAAQTPP